MSTEPEPAMLGTQVTRTMYAAIHGELAPHPRPDSAGEASQDAYSLFYARSAAMGWLTPAAGNGSCGLWGMNEAETSTGSGPQPARVAFFQVALTSPTTPQNLLPVQPFLACAGDVLARLGTLRLEAVQLLLPERGGPANGQPVSQSEVRVAPPLLDAANWFTDSDPRLRARTRVTLDSGPDPSIHNAAPAIARRVQENGQDVFACDSFSLAEDDHLVLRPAPFDWGLPGTAHHRVTFHGTLAEWSLDALGWLATFLADASSQHGVSTQLMFAADRFVERGSPAG